MEFPKLIEAEIFAPMSLALANQTFGMLSRI